MSYQLSNEAEEDLVILSLQGAELFGSRQAERYYDDLFRVFDLIAAHPRMAQERYELLPTVRVYPFKSHLLLYTVDDHDDVLIIRIRHSHEDWSAARSGE